MHSLLEAFTALDPLIGYHAFVRFANLALPDGVQKANVAGFDLDDHQVQQLRQSASESPLARLLLAEQDELGQIPLHPYQKWRGAHWVLACLADLDYPPGNTALIPLFDQVYGWLFSEEHARYIVSIDNRVRRCASQEGNALFAALTLGVLDERAHQLAQRLISWQWPDGGWNCDKRPQASHSSFMESLIPLRALALYASKTGDIPAKLAVERTAQVFLKRRLFLRERDGELMDKNFLKLHYPCYWHYDILFALKVIAEAGYLDDPRCQPALDMLVSKQSPAGSFSTSGKYYQATDRFLTGGSLVDWSVYRFPGAPRSNPLATLDAWFVLAMAGRLMPTCDSISLCSG